MLEANVLDKYHVATGVATFWGLVMLTGQCYKSKSPESRDFIRVVVVIPSLVCLAIGKFM